MCGSGTFVIEAAEIAAGLPPGRSRSFAFEQLASFDAAAWQHMRAAHSAVTPAARFYGSDRDAGAIRMSRANAARAGVAGFTEFQERAIEELAAPAGPPGLVIVNPPYGDRIGEKGRVKSLYRALGHTLLTRFAGWRVGLITSEEPLAKATGLPFALTAEPVLHGGLRVTLFRTGAAAVTAARFSAAVQCRAGRAVSDSSSLCSCSCSASACATSSSMAYGASSSKRSSTMRSPRA